jgi:Zn-dependent membrane protease YugP
MNAAHEITRQIKRREQYLLLRFITEQLLSAVCFFGMTCAIYLFLVVCLSV